MEAQKKKIEISDEGEDLQDVSTRVKNLKTKLNNYVQLNGCSDKLKKKANKVLSETKLEVIES